MIDLLPLPQKKLILGVDGGQSSTLALVADHEGHILGTGLAGPSNHIHEPGGLERLNNALRQSIDAALQNAAAATTNIGYACLGMTGAPDESREIVRSLLPDTHVEGHFDMVTALAGASIAQPGVIVIAGTGAIAYGRLADGRDARAGGWGYIMGDEGSGYDIGVAALRAACQMIDGRGERTQLLEAIPKHYGLTDLDDVHRAIYSRQITRPQIAGLASVAAAAAHRGDAVAQALLQQAGSELAKCALAVIRQLGMINTGITIYTTGGVFQAGDFVLKPFETRITTQSHNSVVRPAAFTPVVGALFLGFQTAGVALTRTVLDNIRATLPEAAISKHTDRERQG